MSKFTWGDDVRVLRPTSARDRWGQSASVIGVFEQRPPGSHFDRFPPGTVYAVEFADGEALDLHEDDLAAGSAAGERRSDDGEALPGLIRASRPPAVSIDVRTNADGVVTDLRCHDGWLVGVQLHESDAELGFRRRDGEAVRLLLRGVCYFALDRFLDGNIVDAAYAWPVAAAPALQRRNACAAFSCSETSLDAPRDPAAGTLFVLESSYGATVYALVRELVLVSPDGSESAG